MKQVSLKKVDLSRVGKRLYSQRGHRKFQKELNDHGVPMIFPLVVADLNDQFFSGDIDDAEAALCYDILGLSFDRVAATRARSTYISQKGPHDGYLQ